MLFWLTKLMSTSVGSATVPTTSSKVQYDSRRVGLLRFGYAVLWFALNVLLQHPTIRTNVYIYILLLS